MTFNYCTIQIKIFLYTLSSCFRMVSLSFKAFQALSFSFLLGDFFLERAMAIFL